MCVRSMDPRSLQYIATACAGELLQGDSKAQVQAVCTDSRHIVPGAVFFALSGEKFNGHDFLPEVLRTAGAALVERRRLPIAAANRALIAVEDTRQALGRLGTRYREAFSLPFIAVGGSNGKTT